MCPTLVPDGKFYDRLHELDQEAAEQTRRQGCPCGGRLHRADYPRKPRGGPPDLSPDYERRISFCCAEEGCRRRVTPPSVRYLGRRVYLSVVVVLASALRSGLAERHVSRLRELLGCEQGLNRRTLGRWLAWWREQMPRSRFWQQAKARLIPPVCEDSLPASLLERFGVTTNSSGAMEALVRFLAPLSRGPQVTVNRGGD